MLLNFKSKIEPALNNKSQIMLSLSSHQPEQGVDLGYCQVWTRRKSSKSTKIYTHATEESIHHLSIVHKMNIFDLIKNKKRPVFRPINELEARLNKEYGQHYAV